MSKHKEPDWDEPKQDALDLGDAKLVRVRCITDQRPFTGTQALALENGQEADVPEAVAKVLVERGHVEIVK
jgi:hypothetical protein